jgi:hypothetical protein
MIKMDIGEIASMDDLSELKEQVEELKGLLRSAILELSKNRLDIDNNPKYLIVAYADRGPTHYRKPEILAKAWSLATAQTILEKSFKDNVWFYPIHITYEGQVMHKIEKDKP